MKSKKKSEDARTFSCTYTVHSSLCVCTAAQIGTLSRLPLPSIAASVSEETSDSDREREREILETCHWVIGPRGGGGRARRPPDTGLNWTSTWAFFFYSRTYFKLGKEGDAVFEFASVAQGEEKKRERDPEERRGGFAKARGE